MVASTSSYSILNFILATLDAPRRQDIESRYYKFHHNYNNNYTVFESSMKIVKKKKKKKR